MRSARLEPFESEWMRERKSENKEVPTRKILEVAEYFKKIFAELLEKKFAELTPKNDTKIELPQNHLLPHQTLSPMGSCLTSPRFFC